MYPEQYRSQVLEIPEHLEFDITAVTSELELTPSELIDFYKALKTPALQKVLCGMINLHARSLLYQTPLSSLYDPAQAVRLPVENAFARGVISACDHLINLSKKEIDGA